MARSAMRIVVVGAAGRMGRMLVKAISENADNYKLHAAVENENSSSMGDDSGVLAGIYPNKIRIISDLEKAFAGADAVIDFTTPEATLNFSKLAVKHKLIHIIGTTGMNEAQIKEIDKATKKIVVVRSGNFSVGVNLLASLIEKAATLLNFYEDWDIEILEMHHRKKVDAPSGTALLLGEAAARGMDISLANNSIRVRDGVTGPREWGKIGFQSLRGGSVVGDHTVIFAGNGERIELRHVAEDRSLFANGALRAASWARRREAGNYSMRDVLGL